jgi:hypothetical protein
MGSYIGAKYYGLFSDDQKLVACMGVRKIRNDIEISRFANLLFTTVRGGFSRLLHYIEKLYKPNQVISFCDLRYSNGLIYEKFGFTLERIRLGWNWTDKIYTYNRLQCVANMDQRGLSEAEHARELGWYKIYDAGQAKYVKTVLSN